MDVRKNDHILVTDIQLLYVYKMTFFHNFMKVLVTELDIFLLFTTKNGISIHMHAWDNEKYFHYGLNPQTCFYFAH